ncbi:MAG: PEP-CTERM sorting domain-containing protein [Natronospirillum sp.]|uniref:Npun_F0296 family exosortase-dependent surface protein n=1 Tax=Natronospirillum sp. TaxID=2812955 RepID=UPI0025F5DD41|nr:PEP-CTERM sorting domain-containing protein [Natronospirillum sp.]MCH8551557.1 PEP-CTERM sorting domain-containing protein [Natronospirillum sp.]
MEKNRLKRHSLAGLVASATLVVGMNAQADIILDPIFGFEFNVEYLGNSCITDTCVDLAAGGYDITGGGLVDPAQSKHHTYLIPGSDTGNADAVTSFNVISPANDPEGSATDIKVGNLFGYFDFYWGSIDTYNEITFYSAEQQVVLLSDSQEGLGFGYYEPWSWTFTGSDAMAVIAEYYGESYQYGSNNQGNYATDGYFRFTGSFDSLMMSSDGVAFELATRTASVPEPGTLALFGAGLSGLVLARRRRKN